MKKRVISGIVYVAILLVFYLLKIFVHDLYFDLFIWFCAIVGTYEMVRANKGNMTKPERVLVTVFSCLAIPLDAIFESGILGLNGRQYGLHVVSILFFVLAVALLVLLVVRNDETSLQSVGTSFLAAVYPTLLLCMLVNANHVPVLEGALPGTPAYAFNSDLMILFIFVASPVADCVAFFVGRYLGKKYPRKLAPKLSPKKTVVGAIGGLIGGLLAGGIIYVAYNAIVGSFQTMGLWLPVYFIIGFLTAAAAIFGDLVESSIKRQLNIKDMGTIMPGHGGVLDRIDGTLFSTMAVYLSFVFVRMIIWPFI